MVVPEAVVPEAVVVPEADLVVEDKAAVLNPEMRKVVVPVVKVRDNQAEPVADSKVAALKRVVPKEVALKAEAVPMAHPLHPAPSAWSNTPWNLMPTRMASSVKKNCKSLPKPSRRCIPPVALVAHRAREPVAARKAEATTQAKANAPNDLAALNDIHP